MPAQIDSCLRMQTHAHTPRAVTSQCCGDKLSKLNELMDMCVIEQVSFTYLYNGRTAQTSYSIQTKSNQSINYTMFPGIVDNSRCGKSINFDSKFHSAINLFGIECDGVVGKPHIYAENMNISTHQVNTNVHSFGQSVNLECGVCALVLVPLPHAENAHVTLKSACKCIENHIRYIHTLKSPDTRRSH